MGPAEERMTNRAAAALALKDFDDAARANGRNVTEIDIPERVQLCNNLIRYGGQAWSLSFTQDESWLACSHDRTD